MDITISCRRDGEIVHLERTERVRLNGLSLDRLGGDGYYETVAAYDPGPRSWYGWDNCDRYDDVLVTAEVRLRVELLDAENHVQRRRELTSARGFRLDVSSNTPRLLFVGSGSGLTDAHADARIGLWKPRSDAAGFVDKMVFRTDPVMSLFQRADVFLPGPRLRPSGLAERLAA